MRLNTWDSILGQLQQVRECADEQGRIDLLIEILVHLRLLGQDEGVPDQRSQKDDIEKIYARIESEMRLTLNSVSKPSATFIYYTREVIKKLPTRQNAEDMIEQIRASAEEFEEARTEDDPVRGFAGDLRKEVHRRLSPRIIGLFLEPYLQLVLHDNPEPMRKVGYVALPSMFSIEDESQEFIDLAQDLLERLQYLWDYGAGNLAAVKRELADGMDMFDRCFMRAEVQSFLEMLTSDNLSKPHLLLDYIKRLAMFKQLLKKSYSEGRIELYDFLLLDLSIGRLVFLLASDLTNNHYTDVTPHNIREALGIILEILAISVIKGLDIGDVKSNQQELEELRASSVYDFFRTKRCLVSICRELQTYLQTGIIDMMSGNLNKALEAYDFPTSRLSSIKTRFFNNFIRRTLLHVLSEFTEKVASAVDLELKRQSETRRLYADFNPQPNFEHRSPESCIAATWREVDDGARHMFGGKGNSILDMAKIGLMVPPAFILGFPLFKYSSQSGKLDNPIIIALVDANLRELERQSGRELGNADRPLLVSIRSGAPMSMPGVMATILNVGITPTVMDGIVKRRGKVLADSLYKRFLSNCLDALDLLDNWDLFDGQDLTILADLSEVTIHTDGDASIGTQNLQNKKGDAATKDSIAQEDLNDESDAKNSGTALDARALLDGRDILGGRDMEPRTAKRIVVRSVDEMESRLATLFGQRFFLDPREQILRCIQLVYASRGNQAVRAYSKTLVTDIHVETAVTVQQLAFGNLNDRSLSGVVITRNPITGEDELFGEFKKQAQGEEVVMGSSDTEPVANLDKVLHDELETCKSLLVGHYRQDLDLEFTVEDGKLYLLQARAAKLGPFANLSADTDFLRRGVIGLTEYRERLDRLEMAYASVALPRADFQSRLWNPPLTVGVPINGGVVSGTLVLTQKRLQEAEARRESVVYLAHTTKPTDFAVMNGAHAIVTIYPGRTSHAAITAMAMNKPCIVGCSDVEIDIEHKTVLFHGTTPTLLREGERVTADGNTGAVYRGVAPISEFFLPLSAVSLAASRCKTAAEAAEAVHKLIRLEQADMMSKTNTQRASLDDIDRLDGIKVLVRVDANIGVEDYYIEDDRRILQIIPALRVLLEKGATPIVCSHLGDPGAAEDSNVSREDLYHRYSLKPVAEMLQKHLGSDFIFHETSVGASGVLIGKEDIVSGSVNLIENLRFAAGEKDNDEAFARSLAGLCDGWFVNDAFNVCQRRHASITGVPKFVSRKLAGPLVARELSILSSILNAPVHPFIAVFGGAELEAQFGVMAALLPRVDQLAVCYTRVSSRLDSDEPAMQPDQKAVESMIQSLFKKHPEKVIIVAMDVSGNNQELKKLTRAEQRLVLSLDTAQTIMWSGPAALEHFTEDRSSSSRGSLNAQEWALHHAIGRANLTVVCSEDEKHLADIHAPGFHLSSGPRAFLEYLERLSLPGLTALDPVER